MRFKGRTALITAAGRGIGRATAEIVGREGGTVIAVDLDKETLDQAVGAIRTSPSVIVCPADSGTRQSRPSAAATSYPPMNAPVVSSFSPMAVPSSLTAVVIPVITSGSTRFPWLHPVTASERSNAERIAW